MPKQLPVELKSGATCERFLRLDAERAVIDEAERTVTLAFASETPVERYWGNEVLDVSAGSMRMDRMKSGAAVLMDHDVRDQVGVIQSVQIGADKVARAVVRFGKSVRASEIFQDIVDGIRSNVSVGYQVRNAILESETDGVGTYRVTDWMPYEISMVSVPADIKTGVGRSAEIPTTPITPEKRMLENTEITAAAVDTTKLTADAQRTGAEGERKRIADITAGADQLAKYDGVRDIAVEAISGGWSMDQFRAKALEKVATKPLPGADIGMSQKDKRSYSLVRVLNALANPDNRRAREEASFEFEMSNAAAEKQSRSVKGVLVPFDMLHHGQRADDLTVGTATAGGNLVATNLLNGSFIDLLRNAMVINRMGVQYLTGLVGNVAIPRQTGGATFYYVAESGAVTDSAQAFDQVPMSPKTGGAKTQISRKLLLQSSLDIESFVRNDLAKVVGLGIQASAIKGGGSNEPVGILATGGIGSVVGGVNGLAPTWANIVALETAVASANADVGTLGYLTNAKVRGKLKTTQKFVGGANSDPIWADGNTPLNGYQAGVTNAVASNGTKGTSAGVCSSIIFGNFADLIIGMWGGLELQVDPYSAGDTGSVIVRAFLDHDSCVRHAESFAAMTDALTT